MKLNIDCVRDLLLTIENEVNFTEDLKYPSVNINSLCESDFLKKYQRCDICYTSLKLNEGGFVDLKSTYGDLKSGPKMCKKIRAVITAICFP